MKGKNCLFSTNRLSAADGIRGFACLIVLIGHSFALTVPSSWVVIRGIPKIGVWLFFVLSAYLLTWQLLKKPVRIQTLIDYFLARAFRILPLYILAVIIYFYLGDIGIKTIEDVYSALLMQKGFAHLWTIPVEFTFYFFLPVAVLSYSLLMRVTTPLITAAVAGIVLICLLAIYPWWKIPENSLELGWYSGVFIMGSVAALLSYSRSDKLPMWVADIIAIPCIAFTIFFVVLDKFGIFKAPLDFLMDKHILFGFVFSVLLLATVGQDGLIARLFNARWISGVGRWSYSIYLFHWFVVMKAKQYFPGIIAALLSIGISIALGLVLYKLIEMPVYALRNRIACSLQPKPIQNT